MKRKPAAEFHILSGPFRKFLVIILMILAILFLYLGTSRTYKVYSSGGDEFGVAIFYRVTDRQIVEDTTFHGVVVRGKKLYSTYDRLAEKRKRSCPT